jgi:beta-lactamase regulating signal transducer with metallopeptidase domain
MTAWMLWAIAITALLGAAAHLLESVLRGRERPGRWAWAMAMAGAIAVQAWALLVENRQPASVPARVPSEVPVEEALSDWWNVMTVRMPSVLERVDTFVGALWLTASFVLLVGLIGGFYRLNRRAKAWPRHNVAGHDVLISENFGPALLGIRSPRIVLPRSLLDQGRDALALVCLHEAKHREARDTWLLAGAALTVAVLPWNAALWWQLKRLRDAIELDCDNRVVADGVPLSRYAGLLLNLGADSEQLSVAIPAFVQPPTLLERRLTMLINGTRRQGPMTTLFSVAAVVLLSIAACEATAPAFGPEAPIAAAAGLPSAGDQPLIFVDGERVDGSDARLVLEERGLTRDDVESIEVLKGFAATDLYGADASGGAIRINLKSSAGVPTALRLFAPRVDAQTGSITGRVIDAQSGQTIPAAQVFIPNLEIGMLSQENGSFILVNVPVGTRPVTVRKSGYRLVTVNVTVTDGQTTALDFRITEQALQLNTSGPRRP